MLPKYLAQGAGQAVKSFDTAGSEAAASKTAQACRGKKPAPHLTTYACIWSRLCFHSWVEGNRSSSLLISVDDLQSCQQNWSCLENMDWITQMDIVVCHWHTVRDVSVFIYETITWILYQAVKKPKQNMFLNCYSSPKDIDQKRNSSVKVLPEGDCHTPRTVVGMSFRCWCPWWVRGKCLHCIEDIRGQDSRGEEC